MRGKLVTLAGAMVLSIAGCGAPPHPGGDTGSPAILAQFISIGAGINEEARDVVLDVACEGSVRGTVIEVRSRRWGFEGEVDYCIDYTNGRAMREDLRRIQQRLAAVPVGSRPLPRLRTQGSCPATTPSGSFGVIDPCAR